MAKDTEEGKSEEPLGEEEGEQDGDERQTGTGGAPEVTACKYATITLLVMKGRLVAPPMTYGFSAIPLPEGQIMKNKKQSHMAKPKGSLIFNVFLFMSYPGP